MNKNFNKWNEIKKELANKIPLKQYFPKEGEVWMSFVGLNLGYEQNGGGDNFSRPVMVIKKFNNNMFWTIPLSTKQKEYDFYYNFTDPHSRKVSVILAQLKLMSVKRLKRKMYYTGTHHSEYIKMHLRNYLA